MYYWKHTPTHIWKHTLEILLKLEYELKMFPFNHNDGQKVDYWKVANKILYNANDAKYIMYSWHFATSPDSVYGMWENTTGIA